MYQDNIDLEFLYHYFDSPGLNQQDFREEFAQIRQRFAKLRLKILIDSLTDSADNSATSTPIKKVISVLDTAQEWSWHTLTGYKFKYFSKRQIFLVLCYENL